ncbi:MAG: pilus assembly protein PilM [Patescibacteria group bacterium]
MAKKLSYLGVDLSGSSIKIVELVDIGGRSQLVTYGFAEGVPSIIKDESVEARHEVANHVKDVLKQSRMSSLRVVTALPNFSVFSSLISLPAMSKKELISAVRWEAKKFVPIPLEEMILDWEVLSGDAEQHAAPGSAKGMLEKKNHAGDLQKKDGGKASRDGFPGGGGGDPESGSSDEQASARLKEAKASIKVLLTAAPKNLVNRYVELFKEAGVQLIGLETESFALERALIGNDQNPVMIIDIGNEAASLTIFARGVPIHNRSIDIGGTTITKAVAQATGLAEEHAEQFKRDMNGSLDDESVEKLPQQVKYVVHSVVNEARYIINYYERQNKQKVSKIILTGGSSYFMDLPDYLQKIFNIKTYIGDPWARVIHPVEIDSLLRQLGPRLAVSVGLAMREIV